MLALKFTQKLLKDMKVAKAEQLSEVDPLFSWHANILQLRKKYIIFVNDYSRLSIVVEGIRTSQLEKLQEKFKAQAKEYLLYEGLKKSQIDQYFLEAGEIVIGKTNDRSVLGTMTEMTHYSHMVEFDHPFALNTWLNTMIYKPHYIEPIELFRELITNRYSQ